MIRSLRNQNPNKRQDIQRRLLSYGSLIAGLLLSVQVAAQHSVARQWNEVLLEAIRTDFARPTVHARNLFHTSIALYDSWAVYDDTALTYFLGKTLNGFHCPLEDFKVPENVEDAKREAMSYACFRLLNYRFKNSPGAQLSLQRFRNLMINLGYDPDNESLDYRNSPAGMGNYLAEFLINYGLQDGSNEAGGYQNEHYLPVNEPLSTEAAGNSTISNPNRWQPLKFVNFIDQSENVIPESTPAFLGAEWGKVFPFSLEARDKTTYNRDGFSYEVYHDPGPPPLLGKDDRNTRAYQWGFSLVAVWSSHLSAQAEEIIDISPASMGNMELKNFPDKWEDYDQFYKILEGGDIGSGYSQNPSTGRPYQPQLVKKGDFARVLAEFWADGPDSETPPGHWFTILNYVSDHPELEKRFGGKGDILDPLEWDVKAYFILGGAMHDAAVSAWGIKGYYDYVRPISAIRYMAEKGQSSDPELPNYDEEGLPLIPGFIELIEADDPLAGQEGQNVNEMKIYSWKGPDYIEDPATDEAGVGWILAENWLPYQRPTFVTPPFAGYVSGHSTFSRAAAEVLTLLTGDPFFPGGMGEFEAGKDAFLVFEEGPSEHITLQWATYRDASDQCSLSRIWGGIHPPADDLPGRVIGAAIGTDAFHLAERYFYPDTDLQEYELEELATVFPNPIEEVLHIRLKDPSTQVYMELMDTQGKLIDSKMMIDMGDNRIFEHEMAAIPPGLYLIRLTTAQGKTVQKIIKK